MATIQYELADGTMHTIRATGNHPFFVTGGAELSSRPRCVELGPEAGNQPGGRWLAARHLRVGDRLRLKLSERATVTQVTLRLEKLHVHNLTVLRVHNFAVGVGGVVVHNTSAEQVCAKIELRINGKTFADDVSYRPKVGDDIVETFDSPADAIGDLYVGTTRVGKGETQNQFMRDRGFTETEYHLDSNGVKHTVFRNPRTGEYTGGHHLSGQ